MEPVLYACQVSVLYKALLPLYCYFRVPLVAMKHHDQKATRRRKSLFVLHFHITVHHLRTSGQELTLGRNPETGADAEAMEGCCLLVCSSQLVQSAFL